MSPRDVQWTTSYPGTQDTDGVEQPDLYDESTPGAGDGTGVWASHPLVLRDKIQAIAQMVGDESNLPTGSLRERISTLETTDRVSSRLIAELASRDPALVGPSTIVGGKWGRGFTPPATKVVTEITRQGTDALYMVSVTDADRFYAIAAGVFLAADKE
jgi:hypothetical protein